MHILRMSALADTGKSLSFRWFFNLHVQRLQRLSECHYEQVHVATDKHS